MRRPASLLSVEKNGGRGKRRARSECEFSFNLFENNKQTNQQQANKQTIRQTQTYIQKQRAGEERGKRGVNVSSF